MQIITPAICGRQCTVSIVKISIQIFVFIVQVLQDETTTFFIMFASILSNALTEKSNNNNCAIFRCANNTFSSFYGGYVCVCTDKDIFTTSVHKHSRRLRLHKVQIASLIKAE